MWLVLFSLVAIPTLALFVACQAPFISHRAAMRRFRRAISWYGHGVIHWLPFPWIRVRYEDGSNNDKAGPFLFVCNHLSSSDPFLMACLPGECLQIASRRPLRLPVWGVMARLAGYLNINAMPIEEFFARSRRFIAEGVSLIAFPEGTRSAGKAMGPFHSTVFRLALQERVAIAPVCIHGSERIPPKGSGVLHPGRIIVRRLPTLRWENYKEMTPFQLKNHVREQIALTWESFRSAA